VSAFVETGISLNIGGILLMSLGAQWYILFNTIAGPIDPHLPPRSHG
jgi:NitT/TauT family transport system permease protein